MPHDDVHADVEDSAVHEIGLWNHAQLQRNAEARQRQATDVQGSLFT